MQAPAPNPTKDERVVFRKNAYAYSSFRAAKSFAEKLLLADQRDRDLIEALSIALVVNYCRPFKGNESFKIAKEYVPQAFHSEHADMVLHRDKVIAHRDSTGPFVENGLSGLSILIEGRSMQLCCYNCYVTLSLAVRV